MPVAFMWRPSPKLCGMDESPTSAARVLVADTDPARTEALRTALAHERGLQVEAAPDLATTLERLGEGGIDVLLLDLSIGERALAAVTEHAPDVPVVAIVDQSDGGAAAAALAAGARDYLLGPALEPEVARRAVRYALERSRMQAELHRHVITDELTGLYNARGFEQLARHHLSLADRSKEPVVLIFVRIENLERLSEAHDATEAPRMLADTAAVLRTAIRESDVPARIGTDAFCVLLTGNAAGAEALVLSRLVEAVATHNARSGRTDLALSVGTATYDPEGPVPLEELIRRAEKRMDRDGR